MDKMVKERAKPPNNSPEREPFVGSFFRSQASSLIATSADYLILIFATELLGLWYVFSNLISGSVGACINFTLGRNWAFKRKESGLSGQAFRYAITSLINLGLTTGGLYLITEYLGFHYILSKVLVGIFVGSVFNFLMQRYFVFR